MTPSPSCLPFLPALKGELLAHSGSSFSVLSQFSLAIIIGPTVQILCWLFLFAVAFFPCSLLKCKLCGNRDFGVP